MANVGEYVYIRGIVTRYTKETEENNFIGTLYITIEEAKKLKKAINKVSIHNKKAVHYLKKFKYEEPNSIEIKDNSSDEDALFDNVKKQSDFLKPFVQHPEYQASFGFRSSIDDIKFIDAFESEIFDTDIQNGDEVYLLLYLSIGWNNHKNHDQVYINCRQMVLMRKQFVKFTKSARKVPEEVALSFKKVFEEYVNQNKKEIEDSLSDFSLNHLNDKDCWEEDDEDDDIVEI